MPDDIDIQVTETAENIDIDITESNAVSVSVIENNNIDIDITETVDDVDIAVTEDEEITISILDGQYTVWGDITGTLSNQTDLQAALDAKEDIANKLTAFQGTPDDTHYVSEKLVKDSLDAKEDLLGYTPANESIEITGAGLLTGQGGDLTQDRTFTLNNGDIDHDQLANTHNLTSDIDHLNISNVGVNTHAQIDTHLALVNEHIDWTNASEDFETTGEVTAEKFNGWGIVPVGGVVAWLKSFTGTPSLPDGFVECNGQVLNDSESVYNGQTIPNLNSGTYHRFLRGAATSGGTGGEVTHKHDFLAYRVGLSLGLVYYYFPANNTTYYVTMCPRYYDVVYVMRVK